MQFAAGESKFTLKMNPAFIPKVREANRSVELLAFFQRKSGCIVCARSTLCTLTTKNMSVTEEQSALFFPVGRQL